VPKITLLDNVRGDGQGLYILPQAMRLGVCVLFGPMVMALVLYEHLAMRTAKGDIDLSRLEMGLRGNTLHLPSALADGLSVELTVRRPLARLNSRGRDHQGLCILPQALSLRVCISCGPTRSISIWPTWNALDLYPKVNRRDTASGPDMEWFQRMRSLPSAHPQRPTLKIEAESD
jgi:hypothetical protein